MTPSQPWGSCATTTCCSCWMNGWRCRANHRCEGPLKCPINVTFRNCSSLLPLSNNNNANTYFPCNPHRIVYIAVFYSNYIITSRGQRQLAPVHMRYGAVVTSIHAVPSSSSAIPNPSQQQPQWGPGLLTVRAHARHLETNPTYGSRKEQETVFEKKKKEKKKEGVLVRTSCGEEFPTHLLIAADGAHSRYCTHHPVGHVL